ncbi:MAG: alpha/beta hydrolase [Candidatus Pseudomonas phytovorans]|uniref:Alpha/beta hydrolase n=1 Tax=Candidatus Pseudomonas phytovorans TaxID=3121377 RepID=A0AAJ6BEC0_9PSED|nr:alpha/beta hydrolase [Pseudomonas sp.]WEK32584.1 MAG: alpha/beta hydrolase [Pseudomonas sp.]
MLKQLLTFAAIMSGLAGCSSQQAKLNEWARDHGAKTEVVQTSPFPILALTPAQFTPGPRLTIYIEGDGHAWSTPSQPSLDPSPHAFAVAELATRSHPGIYVARPCQFVMAEGCDTSVWTNARFSPKVIEAMSAAVDLFKRRYGATSIELVGYSGGAAVALLLAEQRNDVNQIQTIAGNLDPAAWVKHHGLSPLTGSLEPTVEGAILREIPQRHFVGRDDRTIEPELTRDYVEHSGSNCTQLVTLPGDHATVLAAFDSQRLSGPIACD